MKIIDWQLVWFIGTSLAHDYWIVWGLPQVYYWDTKKRHLKLIDDNKKSVS